MCSTASATSTGSFQQAIATLLDITRDAATPNHWESTLHLALLTTPAYLTYLRNIH